MIEQAKEILKELEQKILEKPEEVNMQEDSLVYNLRTLLKDVC